MLPALITAFTARFRSIGEEIAFTGGLVNLAVMVHVGLTYRYGRGARPNARSVGTGNCPLCTGAACISIL
jgi:hypothetical protein